MMFYRYALGRSSNKGYRCSQVDVGVYGATDCFSNNKLFKQIFYLLLGVGYLSGPSKHSWVKKLCAYKFEGKMKDRVGANLFLTHFESKWLRVL